MNDVISFCTLGCRVNQYESTLLAGSLSAEGFSVVPFGKPCDYCVVNTCTVTGESDRKSRQMIRRAAKLARKGVFVTGCFAEVSPDDARKIEGVIAVVGNKNKSVLEKVIKTHASGLPCPCSEADVFEPCRGKLTVPERVRTFIKIEDGCESRCAYCIIPKARGPIRSKDPELIIEEAKALAASGSPEIILTGIEISAYGKDFDSDYDLPMLISDLAAIPDVKRIGLGSLDPTLMTDSFLSRISGIPELIRHFHISLQSGCSGVLARMRRKYNADQALVFIDRIKKYFPDANISADIIVGFPGESEAEFAETVEFCRKVDFLNLHVFPYSVRKGTEAAEMGGQLPDNVKKERVAMLEGIHTKKREKLMIDYSMRTDPVTVLFEQKKNGVLVGHSEHYVELRVEGPCELVGQFCAVRPMADGTGKLV